MRPTTDAAHRRLGRRLREYLGVGGLPEAVLACDSTPTRPVCKTVHHAIRTAAGTRDVTARILSLPLYAVEALPRLLQAQRSDHRRN